MSSSPLTTAVLTALRALGGIATSAELQLRLKASQPTVSRALAPLLQAGTVRKVVQRVRSVMCCHATFPAWAAKCP